MQTVLLDPLFIKHLQRKGFILQKKHYIRALENNGYVCLHDKNKQLHTFQIPIVLFPTDF